MFNIYKYIKKNRYYSNAFNAQIIFQKKKYTVLSKISLESKKKLVFLRFSFYLKKRRGNFFISPKQWQYTYKRLLKRNSKLIIFIQKY